MKKTIRKIEILFMALICIFAMSGMPMQVYAGPADNSLETLTVAEGSLSPAFEGSRMYYTVQVAQDVSNVTVSAKTVNPAATIQSGVGTTTLKTDGDTKIDVVVQAENGNLATYHLTITKSATGAATDTTTNTDTTTSTDTGNTPADNNTGADNGTDTATPDDTVSAYTVSEDFAAEQIPADFTEAQVTYQGAEYRGAAFNNGNLSLLYMTDAAGNEISSYKKDSVVEVNRSNFILWNNKMDTVEVDKVGSQIDVLPTLYNLFGVSYDSRLIIGKDILSTTEGLAIFGNRSWVSDKGTYFANTKKFVPIDGVKVTDEYINTMNKIVNNKVLMSKNIMENNYYKKVIGD